MVKATKPVKSAPLSAPRPPPSIAWPPLSLAPHAKLPTLDRSLHPGIILIDPLFSKQTTQAFLALLTGGDSPIQLEPSPAAKRGEALRTNERFSVQDRDFAMSLWEGTALSALLGEGGLESGRRDRVARGLNPNIRLYRYTEGSRFNRE